MFLDREKSVESSHLKKENFMKFKIAALVFAVLFSLIGSATAVPFQILGAGQDVSKKGTGISGGNANDDANNFFRLQTVLSSFANSLPAPLFVGASDLGSYIVPTAGLIGYDYAVLHYGVGDGGTKGSGGGVEFFYLNGASDFTFPANGLGANGFGGWSTLTLFKGNDIINHATVPDAGSTVLLLGAALSGLGMMARRIK